MASRSGRRLGAEPDGGTGTGDESEDGGGGWGRPTDFSRFALPTAAGRVFERGEESTHATRSDLFLR